ncbi:MAG: LysR family transcriptional regulator [Reyranella sp.]|nr:LysR family transcriptional regulator [Reyranella sp.]MBL6651322.1 LysR family transcriptional regulator [Reyranella sp.]
MDPLLLPLMGDLLEWIDKRPRTYAEVMDGWRTSCPRLPVWEECTDRGLVVRRGRQIELTERGRSFLESCR